MHFSPLVMLMPYLSNEVEGDHVSGLGSDRIGSELELVVRRNRDHHCGGGSGHGLSKSGSEDGGEKHLEGCNSWKLELRK